MGGVVCRVLLVCIAVWFVQLQVAFETAQPFLLLYLGVVALARLALAEHPIVVGCVLCGVSFVGRPS